MEGFTKEFKDHYGDPVRVTTSKARFTYEYFVNVYTKSGGTEAYAELTPVQARKLRKVLKRALRSLGEEP